MGYDRAGFDVVGVDIAPQPHYPFEFHQGDAMTWPLDGFDAVHASPPCQDHSLLGSTMHGTGWMLEATILRLRNFGARWVVENVPGSGPAMPGNWVMLCGSSFGLGVRRHRLFASSELILGRDCDHGRQGPIVTVVGRPGGTSTRDGSAGRGSTERWREAMGIDWMSGRELAQAIPPAYTEYIGRQLVAAIVERAA